MESIGIFGSSYNQWTFHCLPLLPVANPVICFSTFPSVEPENPTESKLSKEHNVARPTEPIWKLRIQAKLTWQPDTKPRQEDIDTDTW